MKVVGEEGTSLADFTDYLKSEFLDAAYLQQSAFSEVDASTPEDRQKTMFDVLEKALSANYAFADKDAARKFFLDLQQTFIDWNNTAAGTPEFDQLQKKLLAGIAAAQATADAAKAN